MDSFHSMIQSWGTGLPSRTKRLFNTVQKNLMREPNTGGTGIPSPYRDGVGLEAMQFYRTAQSTR